MSILKYVIFLLVALALAACGGGGGNAGSTPTGGSPSSPTPGTGGTVTVAAPAMTLSFVNAAGTEITDHLLSQTQAQFLKIVLNKSTGAFAPFTRVSVTLDSAKAVLVPTNGAQLTDASGIVLMRIAPADVNSSGPLLVTAAATVDAIALSKTYELQITPGTVGLSVVSASPASVQKGQSINVSVGVTVNGVAATSNSVAVNFASLCGVASPVSALVDSLGQASAVIQTSSTGNCSVSASASGVTQSTSYTVNSPPVTGIQFVSATPNLIYQTGSAGVNTSIVTFKVIDSLGAGVQGVNVNASLTNTDGGLNFCGSPSSGASAADGSISFSVCAGTLPATVQIRAALDAPNSAIFTASNLLTVQTGLPTQRFFDISATQLNFYAGGYFTSRFNGNNVSISVFAADRQGNPVPDGTKIIFVSEGGQINSAGQSSCLIASGRCSVTLIGQDYRPMGSTATSGDPRPGRVTVLAYTDGEEYFIDKPDVSGNYNNRRDAGELFESLGALYLDKDESRIFAPAYTNLVTATNDGETTYPMPTGSTGSDACPNNSNVGLSAELTCDVSKWHGYTKVRRQIVIVFSGGEIGQPGFYDPITNPLGYNASIPAKYQTQVINKTRGGIVVQLADYDGNPLPADAGLAVEVQQGTGGTCAATLQGTQIGSTTEPTLHAVVLKDCFGGELVLFKATVTSGSSSKTSSLGVSVP
jgi:hypothetical protein